ncbi:MAG TPA: gliding motility-associated ABC transporter substrate-binding protein GldG [Saprospiraceae bacterium]|nr:gliding motility-associated ABC transporter substrate-binding protein GldG [Saprospiraceae bacterium]
MKKNKRRSLLNYVLFLGVLLLLNIIGNYYYGRLDLTEEKRFTLTKATKKLLKSLDNDVTVEILLDGEFPAGFKRLQKATKEILQDFRSQSSYVHFYFNDPNVGSVKEINETRKALAERGISPVRLMVKDKTGSSEKQIYPVAVVHYGTRALIVNLLENSNPSLNPEIALNNSISLLEYKLASAIQKLKLRSKPNIVFVQGHGELPPIAFQDLEKSLSVNANVDIANLDTMITLPQQIDVVLIAKPQVAFSEKEKFVLDQYIMNGGKVIWMIDKLVVSLDSLGRNGKYVPYDYQLNLDDQLFKYGTRIKPNMVLDLECARIPLRVGQVGNAPQLDLFGWYYWPTILPAGTHPIVKSLDRVWIRFGSTIDTIRTKTPIKKTILLASSKYSRTQFIPTEISFEILRYPPKPEKFNKGPQPMAVLLEGVFPSLYEDRVSQEMQQGLDSLKIKVKSRSVSTKMIVISDGDLIRNEADYRSNTSLPLGVNRFEKTGITYANKDFILNAVEYLLEDKGIISARSKDVKLRLLDTVKAEKEKTKWQLFNIVLPLVLLLIGGFLFNYLRKRRYAR